MSETHFNGLTPAEAERLTMLAEECGEVVQAIGKILRHGYESNHPDRVDWPNATNRGELMQEIADVIAIARGMCESGDMRSPASDCLFSIQHQVARWRKKLRYTHHQRGVPA